VRVTRISEDFEFVEINDAITVWDSMGNVRKASGGRIFDPPNEIVPAELQLGKKWTTRSRVSDGTTDWDTYTDYKIVSRERVKVPAGEFEAFVLEGHGRSVGIRWANRLTTRQWVVPDFNFAVKSEFALQPEGVWALQSGELIELVSCRQRRWSVA
jgi:hypothetical protein